MDTRNFRELLEAQWARGNFVCVGLDPEVEKLPEPWKLRHTEYSQTTPGTQFTGFCQSIINATADAVAAYKPNLAFFERHGEQGWSALRIVVSHAHRVAPGVPVIIDAKDADIGNTNRGYVDAVFGDLGADAITVHPYLGAEALSPFLDCPDKGVIVLCRTSNPGAGEFQDALVSVRCGKCGDRFDNVPLYQYVAHRVMCVWNTNRNCGLVVGATYPGELAQVRYIVGYLPILIPGIGAQGGDVEKTVKAGKDSHGEGMIINSSRSIIFASSGPDFADAARAKTLRLRDEINLYR